MNVGMNSWRSQLSSWNGLTVTLKRSFSFSLSVHSRELRTSNP